MNQKTQRSKELVLPKVIYMVKAIPINMLARFFVGIDKFILKFI